MATATENKTSEDTAAATPAPKKRGPKKGYKRSQESIDKARATRAANKAAKAQGKTAAKSNGTAPVKKFMLYSVDGVELGYLTAIEGPFKNGGEAVQKAVADKQVSPAIPVVALPENVLEHHVVDEIPQAPLYVLREPESKPAVKKRTTRKKAEAEATEQNEPLVAVTIDNPFRPE